MLTNVWISFLSNPIVESNKDVILFFFLPYGLLLLTYWGVGLLMLAFDFLPAVTAYMRNIKIQKDKLPVYADVIKVSKTVFLQHITVYPLALWFGQPFVKHFLSASTELPSFQDVLIMIPFLILGAEVWFYYAHRSLHHPAIYPYFHKMHHEYKYPFGLCAFYFHPIEALVNFGVVGSGPIFLGTFFHCHITVLYVWQVLATTQILIHHSGYELPLDSVPFVIKSMSDFHDYHHQFFQKNFGVLGILDYLHGTSENYPGWAWVERKAQKKIN